jgi:hypothetical protein
MMVESNSDVGEFARRQPVEETRLGVRRLARPLADANVAAGRDRGWSALYLRTSRRGEFGCVFSLDCRTGHTRLLIAVVSLEKYCSSTRARYKHGSCAGERGLVQRASLDVQLSRHPSIHQSIAGEKEEKRMAVGVRRVAGRQINKYDYGSRAGCVASTVHCTTHDMRFYR